MYYIIRVFGGIWREMFPEKIYRLYVGPVRDECVTDELKTLKLFC